MLISDQSKLKSSEEVGAAPTLPPIDVPQEIARGRSGNNYSHLNFGLSNPTEVATIRSYLQRFVDESGPFAAAVLETFLGSNSNKLLVANLPEDIGGRYGRGTIEINRDSLGNYEKFRGTLAHELGHFYDNYHNPNERYNIKRVNVAGQQVRQGILERELVANWFESLVDNHGQIPSKSELTLRAIFLSDEYIDQWNKRKLDPAIVAKVTYHPTSAEKLEERMVVNGGSAFADTEENIEDSLRIATRFQGLSPSEIYNKHLTPVLDKIQKGQPVSNTEVATASDAIAFLGLGNTDDKKVPKAILRTLAVGILDFGDSIADRSNEYLQDLLRRLPRGL